MSKYTIKKLCKMAGCRKRYWYAVLNRSGEDVAHCLFETMEAARREVAFQIQIDESLKAKLMA